VPEWGKCELRPRGAERLLEREQKYAPSARTPALRGDARPLGRDDLRRCLSEVARDLPADRRIGVEEPVDDGAVRHERSGDGV
jgi:hypothetical protein